MKRLEKYGFEELLNSKIFVLALIIGISAIAANSVFNQERVDTRAHDTYVRTGNSGSYSLVSNPYSEKRTLRYTLNVTETGYEYLSGKETPVYSFNNLIPGPVIRAKVGDTLEIKVNNRLDEPTTVHWHGMQLPNEMDGVPDVTQEPIEPGESQVYRYRVRNPGTYWYHSHFNSDEQIEKGLQGPLVVDYEKEPYDYEQDQILVLDDIALNEDGSYRSFDTGVMHGRFGNIPIVNGEIDPGIETVEGKTKLRLINTANARTFNLGIENHKFKVTASDIGLLEEPYTTKELQISPGQRKEVIVDFSDTEGNVSLYDIGRRKKRLATFQTGEASADAPEPEKGKVSIADWELNNSHYDKEPDHTVNLTPVSGENGLRWGINGKTYPDNPETFEVEKEEFHKFKIVNRNMQLHPMHLHGQKFKVLSRNGQKVENPSWKDTVRVEGHETVEIGFKAEGEGEWAFHCHILEHAEAGMLSTLKVK